MQHGRSHGNGKRCRWLSSKQLQEDANVVSFLALRSLGVAGGRSRHDTNHCDSANGPSPFAAIGVHKCWRAVVLSAASAMLVKASHCGLRAHMSSENSFAVQFAMVHSMR